MLILLQFPLADLREFLEKDKTNRLNIPKWPNPLTKVYPPFVRFFGCVRKRKKQFSGAKIDVDESPIENAVCNSPKAIRFNESPIFIEENIDDENKFKILFRTYRRFHFDGLSVGKFEIAFGSIDSTGNHRNVYLKENQTGNLLNYFLGLNVRVRAPLTPSPINASNETKNALSFKPSELCKIGDSLSKLYLTASTIGNTKYKTENWWVSAGIPLLFLQINPQEQIELPNSAKSLIIPGEYGFQLYHASISYDGLVIPLWILRLNSNFDDDEARVLRLYLLHLHAYYQCYRIVLQKIEDKNLFVKPKTKESNNLQRYFKDATKSINNLEKKFTKKFKGRIPEISHKFLKIALPGERRSIEEMIEERRFSLEQTIAEFDFRPQVESNLKKYINIFYTKGGIQVGDIIKVKGDHSNINIKASLEKVVQVIDASSMPLKAKEDFIELINELKKELEPAMQEKPEDVNRILQQVETISQELAKKELHKPFLNVTLKGLEEAAKAVASIAPTVIIVAKKIAAFVAGLL